MNNIVSVSYISSSTQEEIVRFLKSKKADNLSVSITPDGDCVLVVMRNIHPKWWTDFITENKKSMSILKIGETYSDLLGTLPINTPVLKSVFESGCKIISGSSSLHLNLF